MKKMSSDFIDNESMQRMVKPPTQPTKPAHNANTHLAGKNSRIASSRGSFLGIRGIRGCTQHSNDYYNSTVSAAKYQ